MRKSFGKRAGMSSGRKGDGLEPGRLSPAGKTAGCFLTMAAAEKRRNALPQTPEELLQALSEIFPEYRPRIEPPDPLYPYYPPTYHSVLMEFAPFLRSLLASASEKQKLEFGNLVNDAVVQAGLLENAFGTCLLEHLEQINSATLLRPYLSAIARAMMRA